MRIADMVFANGSTEYWKRRSDRQRAAVSKTRSCNSWFSFGFVPMAYDVSLTIYLLTSAGSIVKWQSLVTDLQKISMLCGESGPALRISEMKEAFTYAKEE